MKKTADVRGRYNTTPIELESRTGKAAKLIWTGSSPMENSKEESKAANEV